jgi:hypothetical protein
MMSSNQDGKPPGSKVYTEKEVAAMLARQDAIFRARSPSHQQPPNNNPPLPILTPIQYPPATRTPIPQRAIQAQPQVVNNYFVYHESQNRPAVAGQRQQIYQRQSYQQQSRGNASNNIKMEHNQRNRKKKYDGVCANCQAADHQLKRCCISDADGYLRGCPRCNVKAHSYADCPKRDVKTRDKSIEEAYFFLRWGRDGKCPLEHHLDWRLYTSSKDRNNKDVPWTAEYAIQQRPFLEPRQSATDDGISKDPYWNEQTITQNWGTQVTPNARVTNGNRLIWDQLLRSTAQPQGDAPVAALKSDQAGESLHTRPFTPTEALTNGRADKQYIKMESKDDVYSPSWKHSYSRTAHEREAHGEENGLLKGKSEDTGAHSNNQAQGHETRRSRSPDRKEGGYLRGYFEYSREERSSMDRNAQSYGGQRRSRSPGFADVKRPPGDAHRVDERRDTAWQSQTYDRQRYREPRGQNLERQENNLQRVRQYGSNERPIGMDGQRPSCRFCWGSGCRDCGRRAGGY